MYALPNLPTMESCIASASDAIKWPHLSDLRLPRVDKSGVSILIAFAGHRFHAIPLFVSANVLPLNMLYFETVCSLMHAISTNSAPQNICDLFTYSSDVHTYNTRFSDAGNLYVNKSRLRIQLDSFSIFGAKLWNCLKPDLRKLRKKPLKIKIHQFLLAVHGNEADYVDVSTLMLKIFNYH